MRYKLLGLAVWRSSRWYMRRHKRRGHRTAAIAIVSGAVVAGVLAGRQEASSDR